MACCTPLKERGRRMMAARDFAILDRLHHGYHPPQPAHLGHARQLQLWTARFLARVDAADRMLAAIPGIPGEDAPCPPSP